MSREYWFARLRRRRSYRQLRRGFPLVAAALFGWLLSSQWVQSQEVRIHDQSVAVGCWSDHAPAGMAFWQGTSHHPHTPSTAGVIQKPAFRYGDFGATSYLIRHRATGYYQSRVDWVWN